MEQTGKSIMLGSMTGGHKGKLWQPRLEKQTSGYREPQLTAMETYEWKSPQTPGLEFKL